MGSEKRIESIEYYVLKIDNSEEDERDVTSDGSGHEHLPGTDYYLQEAGFVYSRYGVEHLLVKVTTADGTHGWGEAQAPVAPEVPAMIIETLVGPMILGEHPSDVESLWDRMYGSMNIRGHFLGFMIDAMAALDIALWDLKGKLLGESVSSLLGGRRREGLDAYVTGGTPSHIEEGFDGIKIGVYGQADLKFDAELEAIEDHSLVKVDHHWRFDTAKDAIRIGKALADFGVGFVEAPLQPEDIGGAARITDALDVPVALGESLRTTHDFRIRVERDAFDIGQPDINRTGLTEGKRIADLLAEYGRTVAPHMSASMGPGIAATWHVSSAIENFEIQEHQSGLLEKAGRFLDPGLAQRSGTLVVPDGDGLGVDVEVDALDSEISSSGIIELPD